MQLWLIILAVDLAVMSLLTVVFYAWDKRQAKKDGWRVPEKRLHLLSLLGGWPGALLGQGLLRHKSIKTKFRVVFWLTVLMHAAICTGVTYFVWQAG